MSFYIWRDGDLLLDVHVQPRASRDEIAGLHGERLKIRISAPPLNDAANQYLCQWLSKQCGVAKTRVSVISGARARDKRIRIQGVDTLPPVLHPYENS
jgi:uncharacterized protein (TIGR00251 family)